MPRETTALTAEPFFGDKLYQQRARDALPILVRQAMVGRSITYSELADELSMPNPRNLNFVLGSVGQTLIDVGKRLAMEVPPIQCLVINRATGLPGQGVGWFIDKSDFKQLTARQKRSVVDFQLHKIFSFRQWIAVLDALELSPLSNDSAIIAQASQFAAGGESEHHRALKEAIASNPAMVGLPKITGRGALEFSLPSGDLLDVLFKRPAIWIGVEVKSRISDDADIARGMFQCIKYRAVLEALLASLGLRHDVRVLLAVGRRLPNSLVPLRNVLGVEVLNVAQYGG
jgi:hypothetical protein